MRVANDNPELDFKPQFQLISSRFGNVHAYDYVGRCIRAACNLHSLPTRRDRYEELRKALQAAKDGSQNLTMSGPRRDVAYFSIDTWDEVEKDTILLTSRYATLPPHVFDNPTRVQGSWEDLVDYLRYYNANWNPWIAWLQFRLFGVTVRDLDFQSWKNVEEAMALAEDPVWQRPESANDFLSQLLGLANDVEDQAEPVVEDQNPRAILFSASEQGLVDLDHNPLSTGLPPPTDPLYLETLSTATSLAEDPAENSSAILRTKVAGYKDALLHLHEMSGPAVLIVRGEALRLLKAAYEQEDSLDLPPLTNQSSIGLNELVGQHNILVALHPALAEIDKMLRPELEYETVSQSDLDALAESGRTYKTMTEAAQDAFEEVLSQASPRDASMAKHIHRASETGKNLIRLSIKELWRYKKFIGTAVVCAPAAFYAIGKWALANEAILTSYFKDSPGMNKAIEQIFQWLHTLPLV